MHQFTNDFPVEQPSGPRCLSLSRLPVAVSDPHRQLSGVLELLSGGNWRSEKKTPFAGQRKTPRADAARLHNADEGKTLRLSTFGYHTLDEGKSL